jgi:hypothetical protein
MQSLLDLCLCSLLNIQQMLVQSQVSLDLLLMNLQVVLPLGLAGSLELPQLFFGLLLSLF